MFFPSFGDNSIKQQYIWEKSLERYIVWKESSSVRRLDAPKLAGVTGSSSANRIPPLY